MKDIESSELAKKEKERRESLWTDVTATTEVPGLESLDVDEATSGPSGKGFFQRLSSSTMSGNFGKRISYTPKLCRVQD